MGVQTYNTLKISFSNEKFMPHMGANKMKSIARQYFWWSKLDGIIDDFVKSCVFCNSIADNPKK